MENIKNLRAIENISDDYIKGYLKDPNILKTVDLELRNLIRYEPEKAWEVILRLIKNAPDDKFLVSIGVGPLEDILAFHSDDFIDRVESEAKSNNKFIEALACVWRRRNMSVEIWQRIRNALEEQWKDDIVIMQKLLQENGYNIGDEMGIIGPQTKEAVDRLKKEVGLSLESIEEIIEELQKKC